MPNVECSICSEEFGKRTDSSDVVVTPCGHVFHEMCLANWIQKSMLSQTCPECRSFVIMTQTRRIYFNLSKKIDNMQKYADNLSDELFVQIEKLAQLRHDCNNKLYDKDKEIQRLNEKLEERESIYANENRQKQKTIDKLQRKLTRERAEHKHKKQPSNASNSTMAMGLSQLNENARWPVTTIRRVDSSTSSIPIQLQQNCNASTSFQNQFQSTSTFSQNFTDDQSTATSITLQNPFEYDQSNISMNTINSNFRSVRYPLSTYAPSYHTQNSYMTANHIPTIGPMLNPMVPYNDTAHTLQTAQQSIGHTISCIYPIQAHTSLNTTLNTTYFNTNDQNLYTMQQENRK